ncbi:trypsin-like serine peptidase [Nonomuraea antri]|uniref:trypsin-like serine peptidase n=1 Tax=Nonomuraea antri TaxID=2730852 RepID=UPI001C2C2673|nr:trypsin-like peptidase domain-containing protein [Nonomuraea antri]
MSHSRWRAAAKALTTALITASSAVLVAAAPAIPASALAQTPAAVTVPAAPAQATGTTGRGVSPAGEEVASDVSLRYGRSGSSWRTEISRPGSRYVKVHFSSLVLLPGDYVTVAGADGRERHTYFGDPTTGRNTGGSGHTTHGRAGFAALSVDGDTAVITLHATGAGPRDAARLARQGFGARVDRYYRGYTADEAAALAPQAFSVCGTDARRDVVCYRDSHPTEYARSRAVARQLLDGVGHCTAWRVGNTNRMLTNNHCMESAADLAASEFQFDYDCATCGGNNPGAGTKVGGGQFLKTSGLNALDYTLFTVSDFAAVQQFGTLYLDPRPPVAGERIYIPGHGDTRPKRLSLFEETQGGATCKIDVVSSGVNTGYRCDTSGGNSGSPVLAASSHRVIALHHLGGCPNWGTRITEVYNEISSMIDNTPPTGGDDFSVGVSPSGGTVPAGGGSATATVSTTVTGGNAQQVNFSATGLPAGATASFAPPSTQSGGSSTLTLTTTAQTPAGAHQITVVAAGSAVTRNTVFTLTVGTTGGGCAGFETTKTGTLASGASGYQPDGGYFQTTVSGAHQACLDGPDGTDYDLYLQRWNGSSWATVAQSAGSGPDEQLSHTGAAGYYRYRVHAYSGSGGYTLGYNAP